MGFRPAPLQFGDPQPGVKYRDRPAAFGVAEKSGRLALVRVLREDTEPYFDLPGGAIDHGESEARALAREFGEETGLIVRPGPVLARADQYSTDADGVAVNNRSLIYVAEIEGFDRRLQVEPTHQLTWLEPDEALRCVRLDSHAWAIAGWLRGQARNCG